MDATRRDDRARRRRGLALGGVGLVLLFVPAILLLLVPGPITAYALAAMVLGIVLLLAGFVSLPGSLANLLLRPKP